MANTLIIEPPDLPAGTKLGAKYSAGLKPKVPAAQKERRSRPRWSHQVMVPMAPWDSEATHQFAKLRFTTVRCLDLSDGGVAIVLPVLPRFTQAVFTLKLDHQPAHLLARIKDIAEGSYFGQLQFRIGFQFTAVLDSDGSLGPMPTR
jgi:hypothetical protein